MTQEVDPNLNLNTVDEETLRVQLGLPARLVRRVIALRPYASPADLRMRLWGVDAATLDRLAGLLPTQTPAETPIPIAPVAPVGLSTPPEPAAAPSAPLLAPAPAAPRRVRPSDPPRPPLQAFSRLTSLGLLLVLLIGAYFRFAGLNWDDNTHQHPDERFITMTADSISPVKSLAEYFDTAQSSLNPLDYGSYTYGMLPLFVARYLAEPLKMASYDQVVLLGRALSGLFDLAAILVLFLVGCRYYNRRVGLLAAALAAAAVLPIQLSHYFAVDAFSTVFVVAAFWFAAQAIPFLEPGVHIRRGYPIQFALFGLVIGLAMACKINTAPLFGIIGLAGLAHLISFWKDPETRRSELGAVILGWIIAGVMTAVAFRVAQPYAFNGPGFFGVSLNQRWLNIISEVTNQVAGNSEWPPNHHWTDRSQTTYAILNIVKYGLGVPLGITAWLAWLWAAWRTFKGDWRRHLLPVVWVGVYFLWQNMQFWRYMRYFIPIYPILILLAAWALVELYDRTAESRRALWDQLRQRVGRFRVRRVTLPAFFAILALVVVVVGTFGWAFAFTRIYTRPLTRVEASRWMLKNMPGPFNVQVQGQDGVDTYPVEINIKETLGKGWTLTSDLDPTQDGLLTSFSAPNVSLVGTDLRLRICEQANGDDQISQGRLQTLAGDSSGVQSIDMDDVTLAAGQTYYLLYTFRNSGVVTLSGVSLRGDGDDDPQIPLDLSFAARQSSSQTGSLEFTPQVETRISQASIEQFEQTFVPTPTVLQVSLTQDGAADQPLTSLTWQADFDTPDSVSISSQPADPVQLSAGQSYSLTFKVLSGGPLKLKGESYALETSWDDALPLSVDDTNPLGGIYDPLNLELYEPDTPDKLERMLKILDQVNYLVMPSNRAYDAMPRLPQRYPLTTRYYQLLFGCGDCTGDALEAVGYRLEPGFVSPLGFELVASFTSDPNIGPLRFNDQFADESFTVYDHPKVMIFRKTADYNSEQVRAAFSAVDLSQAFYESPKNLSRMPTGLKLPADRLAAQKAGGTWSKMFSADAFINTHPVFSAVAWYLLILLLGWLAFPLLFIAFRGLTDRGYPLARLVGLVFVAWLSWLVASLKLAPFTRAEVALCLLALAGLAAFLAWRRRAELIAFLRERWRSLVGIEVLFLVLFLIDLAVRLANPDLWNPWLGGEKPMEMAFFNSILKTVYFPPEHPWFAGNYINYYYFGYVAAAIPTKLLAILPSMAFNLIIPTWFAMVGAAIFCVVYNLVRAMHPANAGGGARPPPRPYPRRDSGCPVRPCHYGPGWRRWS